MPKTSRQAKQKLPQIRRVSVFRSRFRGWSRPWWSALVLLWLMGAMALAHPHHVSTGTADWIAETQSFEVALNVSAIDLEEVLTKRLKRTANLDDSTDKAMVAELKRYVTSKIALKGPAESVIEPTWIGYEIEEEAAWIYVELKLGKSSWKGIEFQNALLIGAYPEQVNLINVRRGTKKRTLKYRQRRLEQSLPAWK